MSSTDDFFPPPDYHAESLPVIKPWIGWLGALGTRVYSERGDCQTQAVVVPVPRGYVWAITESPDLTGFIVTLLPRGE